MSLLSTPNSSYRTHITYESALQDDDYELPELKLNPLYSALDSGYIYLSHEEYDYETFDYILSPKQVLADGKDSIVLNVFSKDINGNPKPYKDFVVSGSNISATPSTLTSNIDGYARSQIKYTGSNVPYGTAAYLYVTDEENYSATVNYFVKPNPSSIDRLTAERKSKFGGEYARKLNAETDPKKREQLKQPILAISQKISKLQANLAGMYEQEEEYIKKFFRLWSRNQWKRERLAPSFHLDDFNVDPKTWCRFPILSGGFEEELNQLDQN